MKNIFWLNIKIFYTYKIRIFIFIFLLVLLSTFASLFASQIWSGTENEGFFNTVTIGILDLDNSTETRMIISSIENEEQFEGLIEFIDLKYYWNLDLNSKLDLDEKSIHNFFYESHHMSAAIIFPENFGRAMVTGRNEPFTVLYNENAPIAASVIRIITETFTNMLRTSQIGIYTAIDFSRERGISENEVFLGVNMTFLGFILNRSNMFEIEFHSISGRVGIWFAYLASAYITILICGFFIFTDLTRKKLNTFTVEKIKAIGVTSTEIYFGTFFAYLALFLIINLPLMVFTWVFAGLIYSILIISITLSAFGTCSSFLFKNELSSGCFVSIFAIVSLFFSGGIVPLNLMGDSLRTISKFNFSYWGVLLLEAEYLGEINIVPIILLLTFATIFSLIGVIALIKNNNNRM